MISVTRFHIFVLFFYNVIDYKLNLESLHTFENRKSAFIISYFIEHFT